MKKRILSMLLALTMLLSLVPAAVFAAEGEEPAKKYVSLGDSMTNGYGLDGYEYVYHCNNPYATPEIPGCWYPDYGFCGGTEHEECTDPECTEPHYVWGDANGFQQVAWDAYPHKMATKYDWDHQQMAMAGMTSDMLRWILEFPMDSEDPNYDLAMEILTMEYWSTYECIDDDEHQGDNCSNCIMSNGKEVYENWYSIWNFGDYHTYDQGPDSARMEKFCPNYVCPEMYNTLGSTGDTVAEYINIYQDAVKNADIISLCIGNGDFGNHMLNRIMWLLVGVTDHELRYDMDYAIGSLPEDQQAAILELEKKLQDKIVLPDVPKEYSDRVVECMLYTTMAYIVNFEGTMKQISKMNPTADIILLGMVESMKGVTIRMEDGTFLPLGDMMDECVDFGNAFAAAYVAKMQNDQAVTNNIFFAEAAEEVGMIYETYSTEVYRPENRVVRARFFSSIDDQHEGILDYLGMEVLQDSNADFCRGNFDLDDIKAYEAAGYTAIDEYTNAYELYLGFEKAIVEAGKDGALTIEGLQLVYGDTDEIRKPGYAHVKDAMLDWQAGNTEKPLREVVAEALLSNINTKSVMYQYCRMNVGNFLGNHPTVEGHQVLFEAVDAAYDAKYTPDEETEKNLPVYAKKAYDFLKNDNTLTATEKLELIETGYDFAGGEIELTEDDQKVVKAVKQIYDDLKANENISDQQLLDIILYVYEPLLDGELTNAEIRQIINNIYFGVLAVKVPAAVVAVAASGSSSSGSGSLTPADKVAILENIYVALETNGVLDTDTYPELGAVKELYDTLTDTTDGAQLVPDAVINDIFDEIMKAVVNNEEITEDVIADVSAEVAEILLTDSRIKPENKPVIMEAVAETLKKVGADATAGLPTEALDVIKALRAALIASGKFDDKQLGEIIEDITKLVMDGSFDRDTAILADELHNKLLGRDDLSAADKAEIIMIVYSVLEEYGLVESAAIGALAYAYLEAVNKGYLDAAIKGLQIAQDAIGTAKDYVNKKVPAEYAAIRDLMIEELDNTNATLAKLEALLAANPAEVSVEDILALEDDLWNHLDTLKDLGLAAGVEIDPYLKKINKAVVEFNAAVEGIIDEAYAIISAVKSFPEAYAAWVEEVGAKVDAISPELGALVRKYLNDNAADAMAILAVYGDEAVAKLVAEAVAAYGEIADVAMELFYVLSVYGEDIYAAIENNPEIDRLIEAVKAQLAEAKELVEWIDEHPFEGAYNAAVADKKAALDAVYAELAIHYAELTKILTSVIEDVDPIAAEALAEAVDALCKAMGITYDAAEGYIGWLADHADAMACELLCALLENTWEFVVAASPVVDQVMYDWLYTHPYEVIEFCSENAAEIEALIEKYGPAVVGVIAYIGATYGPEVLDFIIENPCEALDMFMDWYNKYGYRIWPMIDVYLEALGVYDAIDEQLDTLKAMLSELDAHILAQIAALKAALKDAAGELREQIEAEIQALYEQLMAFLKANISAYYVVGPNSYYVALGDAGAYGPAADKLAAELGMSDKYANLTFADASASEVLAALNAAEIAKADLITLGFGANTFTAAVAADVMNAVFGEIVEKDWTALVGEEGAAAIEAALVELTAYVAEEVEDEAVAALLTAAVESFAYTYINHLVDYVVVSEAIHEINADALLVLVGMHNPMDGVVIDLDGEQLDLGEYLNYLVMLTNIYSFGYALIAEDTIYVDAPAVETNYDGAVMDIMTFVTDLLGFEEAVVKYQPTDAGYEYIQEQIYNALNPTLAEEEEACQHGAPANLKFQWAGDYSTCVAVYTCSICGEAFTKECLVEILETKQPTVEEEGYVKYQASVEIAGVTYTDVQTVVLAKLPAPDTGDTTMIGLYVTVMLFAAAGAFVVLKKKKHA